jgi:hypothetical protein
LYAGVLGPKDVIFVIPTITGDDFDNKFDDEDKKSDLEEDVKDELGDVVKETEDGYTITVPIKNDEGEYELVDVEYTEVDGTRTISIPGEGDITIIQDENGSYNFELTPEQIKNADNVSCSVNTAGESKCTIKPFVTMVGSKILTADELVLDYTEGENLAVVGGNAKNLKLTDEDSTTDFNKSVIDAGDTYVDVKFSKQGESTPTPTGLDKFLDPFNTADNILNTPEEFKNADFFQISMNTSKMVQTVTNPKDRSQSATRFEVKDGGGVASDITFRNGDQSSFNMNARTTGGVKFIPKPFSSTSTVIETTAPVSANFNMDTATDQASLSIIMAGKDANGDVSELSITEKKPNGDESVVTAHGNTGVNVTQALLKDEKDENGNPKVDSNAPVAFEVFSEKIVATDKDSKNNQTSLTVNGLESSGFIDKSNNTGIAQLSANDVQYESSSSGVLKTQAQLGGGLQVVVQETDDQKKLNAQAGFAYFNNGAVEANLSDGIFIGAEENKNKSTAEIVDGKALQRNVIAIGNTGTVDDGETKLSMDSGFVFQEQKFFDGSSKLTVAGANAAVDNKDYQVNLNDNFVMQTNLDQSGDIKDIQVQGSKFTAKDKKSNDVFNLVESNTSISKDNEVTSIAHTSQGISFTKGDGNEVLNTSGLNIAGVDAGEIKYGAVSFDETTYKKGTLGDNKFSDKIKITGLSTAFYIDDSDPDNPYKNIMADVGSVNVIGADYNVEIMAKDKDGNDTKFSLVFLEEGNNKSYKVFGKDGGLVHVKGDPNDGTIPKFVFESIEYFESDDFKVIAGKQISGSLETVDPKNDKLQTFNFARVNGAESIDGNFKQFSFENGSLAEFDYKSNTNTFLTAADANFVESKEGGVSTRFGTMNNIVASQITLSQNISSSIENISGVEVIDADGNKTSSLSIKNANTLVKKGDERLSIQGANLNAVQADKIQYATLSFDKASTGRGLLKNGTFSENIQITGMNAVFYIDESDPDTVVKSGQVSAEKLTASNSDYNINMTAKDANGVEQKFSVFFLENGNEKSYKIFAEDGSLVHISGQDKDGNIPSAVFKSIELFESKEFRQMAILEMSGSVKTVNVSDDRLTNFSVARLDGFEDKNNNYKQYMVSEFLVENSDYKNNSSSSLGFNEALYTESFVDGEQVKQIVAQDGNISHHIPTKLISGTFDKLSVNQITDTSGKSTTIGSLENLSGEHYEKRKKLIIDGADINAIQEGDVIYGTITVDKGESLKDKNKNDIFDESIKVTGVTGIFNIDNSDPNSTVKSALVDIDNADIIREDYKLNIIAKDENGIDQAFSLFYLSDENGKRVKVFGDDGKLVHISGQDDGKNLPDVVLKAVDYIKTDEFKMIAIDELSGELKTVDETDDKLQSFSVARVDAIQSIDKNYAHVVATDGKVQDFNYKKGQDTAFQFEKVEFNKSNTIDFEQLNGTLTNGVVDFVEYKPNTREVAKDVNLKIGSMIASKITSNGNDEEVITMVKAEGIELLAVDYEEMRKVSGKLGSLFYYDDKNITTIDLKDLNEIKLEDMSSGGIFNANAQRVLRVVEKDDNGEEIGSYLLMNKAFLNFNDKSKGINVDIRVGVLELMQDKLNGKNILLDVDIDGKITLEKGPVGLEVKTALKGKGISHSSSNYKSEDGSFTSGEFSINTQGTDGRIDKLELSAKPNFMTNFFDFKAAGGEGGGRSLQVTYSYDKKNAVRRYSVKFLEGDKVSLKLGPLKFETEKTKDGAEFEQELTLKGQSMAVQMHEISELIGTQKINDWLRVSPGGFITARTGTIAGMAAQVSYKPGDTNMPLGLNAKASSLGASIVNVSDNGDEGEVGVMFTGSSEFNVRTIKGTFEIAGIKQDDEADLPGTVNLYYKKMYSDGDGMYAGVSYDLTTLLIDKDYIDPNASYFDKGRGAGGAGVNFAYRNALSETSALTIGIGANEVEGFCQIKFTANGIEPLGDTINGIVNVLNGMPFSKPKMRRPAKKRRTLAQEREVERLNKEVDELAERYKTAILLEKFDKALNGKLLFTDLTIDDFDAFSKVEMTLGSVDKKSTLADKIKKETLLLNPKAPYGDKVDWLVSQTTGHKENVDKLYKGKRSFDIYVDYLERFNKLRDLGHHAKSIR